MNILVTGGHGTVGRVLVEELRKRGHVVYVTDLAHSHEDFYARMDVREYRQVANFFAAHSIDLVYHAAAEFGRHNGEAHYENLWTTNVIGTKHLLDHQRFYEFLMVFFSSSEIYGDYPDVMREDVPMTKPLRQLNDYAMTKWVSEQQILNDSERYRLHNVRVRLFNTYGPGEYYNEYRSVIARFCYYALHGIPYTVHLGHKRSFSYIYDTVRTLANIASIFKPGAVYNIGSMQQYDIADISKMILKKLDRSEDELVRYLEHEELTTTEKRVDLSLAEFDLEHRSSMQIDEGLDLTLAWMRSVYGK